jgi:nitroimidazol reductase NimA-like FMN-containing flavoprotein (pyridoxamine 5'-phosphate oxidase superfamily)
MTAPPSAASSSPPAVAGPPTARTKVRRLADRGRYDGDTLHAILDEALVAHVGVRTDQGVVVLPMAYGRLDDQLYLHGAAGNALLRSADRTDVCATVTLVDGLVLARSAFHHSINYRSVVVFGTAEIVTDPAEKDRALGAIVDHVVPGRAADCRPANPEELRKTTVLRLRLDEASAKVRTGGPIDDAEDLGLPHWAGVLPLAVVPQAPEPDRFVADGHVPPAYVTRYERAAAG